MKSYNAVRCFGCLTLAALLPVAILGCGGGSGGIDPDINSTVSGKVTSADGQPVTDAKINFEKPGLGGWGADLGADGSYELELATGEFSVSISPNLGAGEMDPSGKMPAIPERKDIPEKYRSSSSSGVKVTVNEGENTFDLTLE